ncbi:MAG: TetR family transcriptional regulator [Kineosporiaceae bacterium]
MAQVLKPEVRARIEAAALSCFARYGYEGTTMARIAAAAETAPANMYRYVSSKEALFAVVVPEELPLRHDELLDARVEALGAGGSAAGSAAGELLDFWLEHRLAVVVLLDRAEGTPYADYPATFVARLVEHSERLLDAPIAPAHREILTLVFDNTRRALAQILMSGRDAEHLRDLVRAFWSYQLPGLDGLLAFIRGETA